MRGVNPDAPPESIAAVVRALAPVLAYPITKVRKVVKRRIIIYEEGVVPWADKENAEPVLNAGRVIPFPVFPVFSSTERLASQALPDVPSRNILPFTGQTGFFSERAPPLYMT